MIKLRVSRKKMCRCRNGMGKKRWKIVQYIRYESLIGTEKKFKTKIII